MGLLTGKKALIFGVANERSIAWGIAEALHREGCELAFTFLGEALEKRVRPLAASVGAKLILPCDVTKDDEIAAVYAEVAKTWGKFDILIHSLAFARRAELDGDFVSTTRDGFALALDVSAYSLVGITRPAVPLLNPGGAILALTFYGSLGPHGIRVNAISAGPIKTLAASGVAGFRAKLRLAELSAPLRRTVTQQEVGNSALYLCSSMASGVTGEIHFVDSGVNIMGESANETESKAE